MRFRIIFLIQTIMLLKLGQESDSISLRDLTSRPKLLPLVPENRTLTNQIEQRLGRNRSSAGMVCLTKNYPVPLSRNGIVAHPFRQWTNFNVYTDPSYNDEDRTLINAALYRISQVIPCVNFRLYDRSSSIPDGDYIHIKNAVGCSTLHIGRIGGRQVLSLQRPDCMTVGVIMHEMMHVLGLDHEHVRADRDNYINILWQNIEPGNVHLFGKYNGSDYSTFGVPYNQRSIMHYGHNYFGIEGRTTVVAKNGDKVGPSDDLQDTDKQKLQRMYLCGGNLTDYRHNCESLGNCHLSNLIFHQLCKLNNCWE